MNDSFRICFISGKLGDVDGVSLEVDKWIEVLREEGHTIHTIAGKYGAALKDVPREHQYTLPQIRFDSERQRYYEQHFFPYLSDRPFELPESRTDAVLEELLLEGERIAAMIYEYIQSNGIDVLIAQNTNAMPMALLAGTAIHSVATKRRVATIFHHHDFWWERSRFSNNSIEDFLTDIMPPSDIGLEHVVISSYAAHILRSIKRVPPHIIPNCENFKKAVTIDDYNADFRSELGFGETDILVVQPTRIIRRKRIEDSVEFVSRLQAMYPEYRDRLHYIISLYQGDEPDTSYLDEIQHLAEQKGVSLRLIADRVASFRGMDDNGRKLYTNRDVLAHADLVTYLPIWEGFGNALIETIAARVPAVVTTYLVYKTDIKVAGFRNIEIRDNYDDSGRLIIPDRALEDTHFILTHPDTRKEMTDINFRIGETEFGFGTLKARLAEVFEDYGDEIRASRRRLKKSLARYSV